MKSLCHEPQNIVLCLEPALHMIFHSGIWRNQSLQDWYIILFKWHAEHLLWPPWRLFELNGKGLQIHVHQALSQWLRTCTGSYCVRRCSLYSFTNICWLRKPFTLPIFHRRITDCLHVPFLFETSINRETNDSFNANCSIRHVLWLTGQGNTILTWQLQG